LLFAAQYDEIIHGNGKQNKVIKVIINFSHATDFENEYYLEYNNQIGYFEINGNNQEEQKHSFYNKSSTLCHGNHLDSIKENNNTNNDNDDNFNYKIEHQFKNNKENKAIIKSKIIDGIEILLFIVIHEELFPIEDCIKNTFELTTNCIEFGSADTSTSICI